MNIKELKKKYPKVEFYKLKKTPDNNPFTLNNLDDFFKLATKVVYFEEYIDTETASYANYKSVLNVFVGTLPYSEKYEFEEYVKEYAFDELIKMCKCDGYDTITLYGLEVDVMYEDEEYGLDALDVRKVFDKLKELYRVYSSEKKNQSELKKQEIQNLIDSYSEKYANASSKSARENIITEIQLILKDRYGLDGRSDSRASKASLRMNYESYILKQEN